MAERRTRYNELLGVPNEFRDPDLYQLLGLDRVGFDPAAVDPAYKEQMSRLQKIRSPKHKSFIEFLKGELRRARTALTNPKRREEYDAELLEERREQLSMILDVVLADGILNEIEEERLRGIAKDVGLLAEETERVLNEELAARGAIRERDKPTPEPKRAPTPRPSARPGRPSGRPPSGSGRPPSGSGRPPSGSGPTPRGSGRPAGPRPAGSGQHKGLGSGQHNRPRTNTINPKTGGRVTYTSTTFGKQSDSFFPGGESKPATGSFFPTDEPPKRAASDSDIQSLVGQKLKPKQPPSPTSQTPSEPIVTAELVQEPPKAPAGPVTAELVQTPTPQPQPQPQAGWGQTARSPATTGWGRSAQVRQIGVCTGCLTPVTDQEVLTKRAERFQDGRIHCPACTNRLIAGLICARCSGRITRAEMKAGQAFVEGARVSHRRCAMGG